MDRLKNFWRSSNPSNNEPSRDDSSLFDRAENFLSSSIPSSFRRGSIQVPTTSQFDDYLLLVASLKHNNKKGNRNSTNTATLRPELVDQCYKNVDPQYFSQGFQIETKYFERKSRVNVQRLSRMQEQLDEVQYCLFNQITSRFDEILLSLRTLEALSFVVSDNQAKLKSIRQGNFKKVMGVTERQMKMAQLLRKKKNMEHLVERMQKIKQYADFIKLENQIQSADSSQAYYVILPNIKNNILELEQYRSTRRVNEKVEEVELSLRRSFSDKVNSQIFEYLKGDKVYKKDFWRKFINLMSIFEDREAEDTAILDESTYGEEETVVVLPKRDEGVEVSILNFMKKGWEDGEYSIGKLKSDVEGFLRGYHNNFILDFRNFCDQVCRSHEREMDNPNLPNLLREMSITFCAKVYTYFFDIHKSILLRYFSLIQKCFKFITEKGTEELTIEQKEKLKLIADGFVNTSSFLVKIILEKLIDLVESKFIHEGVDIGDFKLVISVLENAEEFIKKQLFSFVEVDERISEACFLGDFFCDVKDRYQLRIIEQAKHKKVLDYLNRMHKNALTVELKESLENEIWQPTDIPTFYYDSLHYLITGESLNLRRNRAGSNRNQPSVLYDTSVLIDNIIQKEQSFYQEPSSMSNSRSMSDFRIIRNDIIISGRTYKVTQTVLLMLEILEDYLVLTQNFPFIREEVSFRMNEVIRSYNSSSCQLIVHAGAVALQKIKTKNITSRHLGLSSLCLSFIIYIMSCIEKRLQIYDSHKLKSGIEEHINTIVKKLNQILIFKANSVQKSINLEDIPSKGTAVIVNNTKILLEILSDYYDRGTLSQIFTEELFRIYIKCISEIQIDTRIKAQSLKDDVKFFFSELHGLEDITPEFKKHQLAAQDVIRRAFEEL